MKTMIVHFGSSSSDKEATIVIVIYYSHRIFREDVRDPKQYAGM